MHNSSTLTVFGLNETKLWFAVALYCSLWSKNLLLSTQRYPDIYDTLIKHHTHHTTGEEGSS